MGSLQADRGGLGGVGPSVGGPGLEAHEEAPAEIVLDLDVTDDALHGAQEGRFFHGYYGCYCYMPLYVFCGDHLLLARLRCADRDASAGTVCELAPIVARIREAWPSTRIVVRGDSGFCREQIMAWCESEGIGYVFGIARNPRLVRRLRRALNKSRQRFLRTKRPSRRFREFRYRTRSSWSRKRRVVGKAEWLQKGSNPRFVVSNLPTRRAGKQVLYEELYCARGDMENRIKEQQLGLFADRTSSARMAATQLRLYVSSFAYVLLAAMRRLALAAISKAHLQCSTLRLRFLKIAARIRITHRRIWIHLPTAFPWQTDFAQALAHLQRKPLYHPPA